MRALIDGVAEHGGEVLDAGGEIAAGRLDLGARTGKSAASPQRTATVLAN